VHEGARENTVVGARIHQGMTIQTILPVSQRQNQSRPFDETARGESWRCCSLDLLVWDLISWQLCP